MSDRRLDEDPPSNADDPLPPDDRNVGALVRRVGDLLDRSTRDHPVAWTAAIVFLLALAAALISTPGRYVADARFEIYWGTGRYLRSQLSLWDGIRNIGRPSPYFSPVIGLVVAVYRLLGANPALAERLLHATMIAVAGAGAAALATLYRPRDRTTALLAGLIMAFNPVVAEFLVPSGIFFHYAVAPWLVWCVVGALTPAAAQGRWTWPARAALIVFSMGAINSASLLYACLPATVMAASLVLGPARVPIGRLWSQAWRAAVLAAACGAAAVVVLAVNAPVVAANLSVTELPETVSGHSSFSESLRGLGYWLTYFGGGGTTRPNPSPYVIGQLAAVASLLLPTVAIVSLVRLRWRWARSYGWMLAISVVAMVGLYPSENPTPLGSVLSRLYDSFPSSRFLRNGYKAGAGWALAVAILAAFGISVLIRRIPRPAPRRAVASVAAATVLLTAVPFWSGDLYPTAESADGLPAYWYTAASAINRLPDDGRVLILPGANRTRYTWGYIGDDLFDALLSQPHVARSTLPQGTPEAADLVDALDSWISGPEFQPGDVGPMLRRLGIRWIVLRNDLDWEAIGAPRPALFEPLRNDPSLKLIDTFGRDGENTGSELPPVELFEVTDSPGLLRVDDRAPILLAGSGSVWPDLSAAGYLDRAGPVRYLPDLSDSEIADLAAAGAPLIISDGNRRRVQRGTAEQNYLSPTLPAGADADGRPARPLFPGTEAETVADYGAARSITASSYGSPSQVFPLGLRPSNATDGNPRTAWAVSGFGSPIGERLTIELKRPTRIDRVSLTQVRNVTGGPSITRLSVIDERGRTVGYDLQPSTTALRLPGDRVRSLTFRIDAVSAQSPVAVGLAEVGLVDASDRRLDLVERLQVPNPPDLDAAGKARFVFSRSRTGAPLVEEASLHRGFRTARSTSYSVRSWVQVGPETPDIVLDSLANRAVGAYGSSRFRGELESSGRGAVDAVGTDLGRSWSAQPVTGETLTLRLPEQPVSELALVTAGESDTTTSKILTAWVSGYSGDSLVFADRRFELSTDCAPRPSETSGRCLARTDLSLPNSNVDRLVIRLGNVRTVSSADGPLPAEIVEVGINGRLGFGRAATRRSRDACTALLNVDDRQVAFRLPSYGRAVRGPVALRSCAPLRLEDGRHRLDSSLTGTGFVTRVELVPTDAPALPGRDNAGTGRIDSQGRTAFSGTLDLDADAAVVLGESAGAGWSASFDGHSSERSSPMDTLSGWQVDAEVTEFVATYTPQRTYLVALAISFVTVTLSFVLALGGRPWRRWTRRRGAATRSDPERTPAHDGPSTSEPTP